MGITKGCDDGPIGVIGVEALGCDEVYTMKTLDGPRGVTTGGGP